MPELLLRNLPFLAHGLLTTLALASMTAALGTALAIPVALLRFLRVPVLAPVCALYVGFVRGTPLLVMLLLCAFALPALLGTRIAPFPAALLGFTLFLGAYAAEDMRAGLLAVPAPLVEAATALGLSRARVLRWVVLPLAARIAVPALFGQYVRMLKYTSVASVLGVAELTGSGLLVNARVFRPLPILLGLAAAYLAMCLSVSMTGRWIGRRMAIAGG